MASRRTGRERKLVRQSLNENELTLEASQHDDDAAEEYHIPKSRGKRAVNDTDGDVDMEHATDDDEKEEHAKKGRGRKAAPAANGVPTGDKKRPTAKSLESKEYEEIDRTELPNQVYQAIANTKATPGAISHEILSQYQDSKKTQRAILGLVNALIQSCGCVKDVQQSDLDMDAMDIVKNLSDVAHQSSIEPPIARIKNFADRWVIFWQKFTTDADTSLVLYGGQLFPDVVLPWLQACSASPVRAWRKTATLAAFAVIEQLNTIAISIAERIAVVEKQLEDKKIKKNAAEKLQEDLETENSKLDVIHDLLNTAFNNIYVHRFRDVNPDIRLVCVQQLGLWLRSYPSHWLVDSSLKYLGWTLNDKEARVRFASLEAIVELFELKDTSINERMAKFCARFKPRFKQMTLDVDGDVAAKALEYLTHQLNLELMEEEDGNFADLLWDSNPTLRERAVEFVYQDVFAEDEAKENHQEDITQVLNIFDSSCPMIEQGQDQRQLRIQGEKVLFAYSQSLTIPMDMLVNDFFDRLPALRDYDAITSLIMKLSKRVTKGKGVGSKDKPAPEDEDRQLLLCHLLASVSKRVCGRMEDPNVLSLATAKKKSEREAIHEQIQNFSAHFIEHGSELLTLYQQDATKLRVLLPIFSRIDVTLYDALRKQSEFTNLLKRLTSIYAKLSDEVVLQETANALRYLVDTDHQLKDKALESVTGLAVELAQELNTTYQAIHGSQIDMEMNADDRLRSMVIVLKRMVALHRALRLKELQWDSNPALDKMLQYYATNHEGDLDQEITTLLMHYGFATLAWNFATLQQEVREQEPEEKEDDEEEEMDENAMDVDEEHKSSSSKKKKAAPAAAKKKSKRASAAASSKEPSSREKKATAKLIESTHLLTQTYVDLLRLALTNADVEAFPVKDTVFKIFSDLFIMFSGKLTGTVLEPLAISVDALHQLQSEYNAYFTLLIDAVDVKHRIKGVSEKQRQAFIADQRVTAFKDAIKVALYDMNSLQSKDRMRTTLRHRELAGLILSRFGSMGEEVDALLKAFMHGLKNVSNNTLLQAQLEALEFCFNQQIPEGELKALSTKFVMQFPINPSHRSFTGFLRQGMIFALAKPPTNLKFLDHLVPFVQRANLDDCKNTAKLFTQFGTRCLQQIEPDQRSEEDEWEAIQNFAEAVNKKFSAPVLVVEDRSVIISRKAAQSIPPSPAPATPARGKKGRKGAAAEEEEEPITGALTPMGSPGIRKSQAGAARRSRQSAASDLAMVEESEEEVEAANERRKSAGGRKRGRAVVEEEEVEQKEPPVDEDEEEANGVDENSMEIDEQPKKGRGRPKKSATTVEKEAPKRGKKRQAE